jgi:protein TonB
MTVRFEAPLPGPAVLPPPSPRRVPTAARRQFDRLAPRRPPAPRKLTLSKPLVTTGPMQWSIPMPVKSLLSPLANDPPEETLLALADSFLASTNGVDEAAGADPAGASGGGNETAVAANGAGGHGGFAPPQYWHTPQPPYPAVARANGWEGKTLLRLQVEADGTVSRAELLRSSGHDALDRTALRTAQQWRFHPAQRERGAVPCAVEVPISFRLRND